MSDDVKRWRAPLALLLDAVAVIAFVVVGRREHEEGSAVSEVVEIALPFLIGLGAGWLATRGWKRPTALLTGVAIWATTLIVGMAWRRWVFGRGTAPSFVIVTAVFLAACLIGWRAVAWWIRRRRTRND